MAHMGLFAPAGKAKGATTKNEAGGRAYAFTSEHALAQYVATGTLHGTFYANEADQLDKLAGFAKASSDEFVAKAAVYSRTHGHMKDAPAFLVAHLAARNTALMKRVFPRVIDNGKMLRNFVQIVRSGVTGRKSLGSAPKHAAQAWFRARSPEAIWKSSIGTRPSMSDVIRLVRPAPKGEDGQTDAVREALYGYLIGKDVNVERLPPAVLAYEAWKKSGGPVPDVPFEMLTALPLGTEQWSEIARHMTWQQTRINLNTLLRHGVFGDPAMVSRVASRIADPGEVRRARVFPFQLLAAFRAASANMPPEITLALQSALEVSIENVPSVKGKVYLCPDVSGSMHSPVTGNRGSATTSVRCIDVAALVSAAFLRRNVGAEVIPFSDDIVPVTLNPLDSVMTNSDVLSRLPSGGTACSAPLRHLNKGNKTGDLVVYVSDNMSWADFERPGIDTGTRGTVMAEEWARFKRRSPNARLVLIDLQPYASTQVTSHSDVLNVGGFSDVVFDITARFARGELEGDHFVEEIAKINL